MTENNNKIILHDMTLRDGMHPKRHQIISFIKSGIRIGGYIAIPFNLELATIVLILSEMIGIAEELV